MRGLGEFGLKTELLESLDSYANILLEWNRVHNLTGAKNKDEVFDKIYDSIYPMKFVGEFKTLLDIGSGAGFPGMVLSIVNQNKTITLLEPLKKRVAFLNYIKVKLKLNNLVILNKRVEEVKDKRFDIITSKAVMSANKLYNLSKDLMNKDSIMILYKGRNTNEELQGIDKYKIIDTPHSRYIKIFR